jgi:cyclopropane fatty-acyl-phospholipid synthase-like methyltransferase
MSDWLHKEYPKQCSPTDFWGQIKRTVKGEPVSNEQISLIISAVKNGLSLGKQDHLLDLACGNGALSSYLFPLISRYNGVDFSDYLIKIAKDNFEIADSFEFTMYDVADYVIIEPDPLRFTKCLCYGSFSYFDDHTVNNMLCSLFHRFKNVSIVYIGNLPDSDRRPEYTTDVSQIGVWRTKNEFYEMCTRYGWTVNFHIMPKEYYASYYRYDAILIR